MNDKLENLRNAVEPLRQQIIGHKVYASIKAPDDLKVFMQYHVFAVWDFMSLLKSLQNNLTCTLVPWFPKGSADMRYLINEIVTGEESDIDYSGNRKSHFELYLDAMRQCGADTSQIDTFTTVLKDTGDLHGAFTGASAPLEVRDFVDFTFQVIGNGKDHLQAAVFTFGREDLIPGMFISMIRDMDTTFPDSISVFKYYLERHIEVDGEHHSHLALQMVSNLCGMDDRCWKEAEEAAKESLQRRINLWDGAYGQITKGRSR